MGVFKGYNRRATKKKQTAMAARTTESVQKKAAEMVRKSGVRQTRQRQAVLEAMLLSPDHPTAALIFERASERCEGLSLATVYNSLEALSEAGVINHLHFDNGPSRYCPNLVPHVHLVDPVSHCVLDVQLKPGLHPEDVFDLPEGTRICRMDACLQGNIPDSHLSPETT